ncbi:uncharacterized protein CXorf65 homolog [Haliaeetus albicilla]|uniref:uncharacterized protein CXorf65 homolog n=1 Tax=Haliaeetus albicilla TaxID=8969 RepID=UPI0037E8867D
MAAVLHHRVLGSNPTVPAPGPRLMAVAHSSTSSCQSHLLHSATAALPADDQSLPANASCTVLRLVSYVRMVGVPDTAFPNIIHPCDELSTPKLLFQVTSLSERTSKFLQACGTYYMCRVEFGAPGTEEENTCWSFTLLLEHPSAALTGGRGDGEQPGGQAQAWGPGAGAGGCQTCAPEMLEERRMPDMETLPSTARGQGAIRGCQWPPGQPVWPCPTSPRPPLP